MKATDIKDIYHLKSEIEKQTDYEFEIEKDILGEDVLRLIGLPQKNKITLGLSNYSESGEQHIDVCGEKRDEGYTGFGCPCNDLDKVKKVLKSKEAFYGYKRTERQLKLTI